MFDKSYKRRKILLFLATAASTFGAHLYSAVGQVANSINVKVSQGISDGKIVYGYQISNATQGNIVYFQIGFDDTNGEAELTDSPIGWDYFNGLPANSIKSPYNWQVTVITTDESNNLSIVWEPSAQEYALLPGKSLSGFFVYVPQASTYYINGHWKVILDNGLTYSGLFKVR